MEHTSSSTLDCLFAVEASGDGADTFTGMSVPYPVLGIYGGHFLGQALHVGLLTVAEPKLAHSFHAYFLRAGNPELPINYAVERIREGRNYESRTITASQQGHAIFRMMASFKLDEPGDQHADPMPDTQSAEETLHSRLARGVERRAFPFMQDSRIELELISDFPSFDVEHQPAAPNLQMWMRIRDLVHADRRTDQVLLAYLADGTLMFNAVRPHGVPFITHRLTSLDQAVWFYHSHSVSDWILFDQKSTIANDSRALNLGTAYNESGQVVFAASQESMLRRTLR